MLDRHIFLIGMAGSGKTSLGRRVAKQLRISFIDMDTRIEELTGLSIPELFQQNGEEAFRHAETNTLITLWDDAPAIVSTGGGAVLSQLNFEIMRNMGLIILIDRPPEDIMQDIRLETRPLLMEKGIDAVPELYNARIDRYRATADMVLDNTEGYQSAVQTLMTMISSRFHI